MSKLFSFTHLSDNKRIFLGEPNIDDGERDDSGYQHFDVYDDEYLGAKLGGLGICASGTVGAMWGFGEENDAREKLTEVMRLAFPLINLPISPEQYAAVPPCYFPVVELLSEGKISYDERSRIVHLPSGTNPEDFFKSTVFSGKLDEYNVEKVVLMHGYLEGLNDNSGDYRFVSIEITKQIWQINPVRVTKAYRSLVEDGRLEQLGGNTSSGFPSFTRVPSATRRLLEAVYAPTPQPDAPPSQGVVVSTYISSEIERKLIESTRRKGYETTKLEAIISELNDASERGKAQSSHALTRALLDHIAPLFNYNAFAQVANNYAWSQTDKKRIQQLNTTFRFDADDSLHTPISKRNNAVDMVSIGLIRRTINTVLEEAASQE